MLPSGGGGDLSLSTLSFLAGSPPWPSVASRLPAVSSIFLLQSPLSKISGVNRFNNCWREITLSCRDVSLTQMDHFVVRKMLAKGPLDFT